MTVELHPAFHWDCDECGREQFIRAYEGNLEEPAMARFVGQDCDIVSDYVIPGDEQRITEDGDEERIESDFVVNRVIVAPKQVQCVHCGAAFMTTIPHEE